MGLIDGAARTAIEDTPVGRALAVEAFDLARSAFAGTRVAKIFGEAEAALARMGGTAAATAPAENMAGIASSLPSTGDAAPVLQTEIKTLGHTLQFIDAGANDRALLLPNGTQVIRNAAAKVPYTTFRQLSGKEMTYWSNGWRAVTSPGADMQFKGSDGIWTRLKAASINNDGEIVHYQPNTSIGGIDKVELDPAGARAVTDPLGIRVVQSEGNTWTFYPGGKYIREFPNGKVFMSNENTVIPDPKLWAATYREEPNWSLNGLRNWDHEESTMH